MVQPWSDSAAEYYRRVTSVDIGEIAHELLNGKITQSSERTLFCDCPNHQSQSKRSLNIMLDKQGWYCFGCGKGGDVLQLVEFVHAGHVTSGQCGRMPESHREARDYLAARVGVPTLTRAGLPPEGIEQVEEGRRRSLRVFEALTSLADYYNQRLLAQPEVLKWFQDKYRIGDEMIARLKIGYAANGPWKDSGGKWQCGATDALKKAGFTDTELAGSSAFRPSGSGLTPFLCRRVVFPYWSRGHVVYMAGRKTPWTPKSDWEAPKYKKLPVHNAQKHAHVATCIRNDVLYNEDVLATRPARVVITEGVTDCISLMEHGFAAISPTTAQIREGDWERILPKLKGVKTVYICQDNELSDAGLRGALRTAEILGANGIAARVATLPLGDQQRDARKQLKEDFGLDGIEGIGNVGAGKDRTPEQVQLIAALMEQAKIDVNAFFAQGGTASDFEAVLTSGKAPLELLISRLPADTAESDVEGVLAPLLAAVKPLSPVEQDRHLRLIQDRLGKDRVSLTVLRKQLQATTNAAAPPRTQAQSSPPAPTASGLPRIQVNGRQLRDIVTDAWAAVHRANQSGAAVFRNTPYVFRRGEQLVYLAERDPTVEIEQMNEAAVYGLLARVADWFRVTDEKPVDVLPLKEAARDILAYVDAGLPRLDAVIRTPVFGSDGKLITAPGYHRNDRVWMDSDPMLHLTELPSAPTADDIRAARDLFCEEMLVDFPFTDDSDRAHAMAAILLPFVRRMVAGPTPLHLIEAPTAGSGKGLLANLIAIISVGANCESRTLPEDDDEVRKMITAELMKARPIVLLDNTDDRKQLHSPALASVLTAMAWTDRVLGESKMVSLANQGVWIMTANNPHLDLELARRCVRIRIDPRLDRPWQRTEFRHPDLVRWVKTNRGQFVHAALTLVLGWIAAGKPVQPRRLGSFEEWSEICGGILAFAEIDGFLANLDQLYDQADQDGQKWREFTAAWWDEFGDAQKQVSELHIFCERRGLMLEVRGEGQSRSQQVRLGKALARHRDRVFGNLRVVKVDDNDSKHKGVSQYRLVAREA